jgi:hypothetical protein
MPPAIRESAWVANLGAAARALIPVCPAVRSSSAAAGIARSGRKRAGRAHCAAAVTISPASTGRLGRRSTFVPRRANVWTVGGVTAGMDLALAARVDDLGVRCRSVSPPARDDMCTSRRSSRSSARSRRAVGERDRSASCRPTSASIPRSSFGQDSMRRAWVRELPRVSFADEGVYPRRTSSSVRSRSLFLFFFFVFFFLFGGAVYFIFF